MVLRTKIIFPTSSIVLLLFISSGIFTPAFASLIGDTMHVKIVSSVGTVFCDEDVVVVDPGVEIPNCLSLSVDIDGDSIWLQTITTRSDGSDITGLTYEFTNMDWTGVNGGMITGVTEISPTTIPIGNPVFDAHSITVSNPQFFLDCGGQSSCLVEWHLDISTNHLTVGGELVPLDNVSLVLAYSLVNSWWIAPIGIGVGVGIYLVKRKF